ncbi:hypothetical protein WG899_19665 [Paucibacter sp. AS339]|uniref:hypothetical protein n=1 Tax=Paucibacter hankyongi TaxID=3133434 RepID=UPI0030AA8E3F
MTTVHRPHFRPSLAHVGMRGALGLLLSSTLLALPALAVERAVAPLQATPSWQARLQLSSLTLGSTGPYGIESPRYTSSRLLSANLLGDYYLTGSGLGGVQGGLRATGGLMLGSLSHSSASLALGASAGSLSPGLSIGQRSLGLGSGDTEANDPNGSMSYLGIGYTGRSLRGGWGISADLGLVNGSLSSGLRLGSNRAQGMEDLLRDMRFRPVLQLGLSYSY